MSHGADILLQVSGLTKRYNVTVLDRCDLQVAAGEIHALLGANGAGKSTLVKIIAGLVPADGGQLLLHGRKLALADKPTAEAAGVQIVQQELNLIPTLSVAENLLFGRLPARGGVIRRRELHRRARVALDRLGLDEVDTETPVAALGLGRQQMVEIAAALDRDCKLLILDEPTAALTARETDILFERLLRLRDQGVGIIYISHRLDEVRTLADRFTVLRDGKTICTESVSDTTTEAMVQLMSADAHAGPDQAAFQSYVGGSLALRVAGISCGMVRDVTFSVRRGERLGIAGLVGSGRTELLRAIFGADHATAGHVFLGENAAPRRFLHPRQAVAAGLGMVTEDRKQNGLLLEQSIRMNTSLSALSRLFSKWGVVSRRAETRVAGEMRESLAIHCHTLEQAVGTLSGGNQQKVVVSKWLVQDAQVLLFDEPTRGIDIAARRQIYRLFETLAAAGKGIVIVSSDLDELLETCDTIAVLSAGRLVQSFDRANCSRDAIMQASFSGYVSPHSA